MPLLNINSECGIGCGVCTPEECILISDSDISASKNGKMFILYGGELLALKKTYEISEELIKDGNSVAFCTFLKGLHSESIKLVLNHGINSIKTILAEEEEEKAGSLCQFLSSYPLNFLVTDLRGTALGNSSKKKFYGNINKGFFDLLREKIQQNYSLKMYSLTPLVNSGDNPKFEAETDAGKKFIKIIVDDDRERIKAVSDFIAFLNRRGIGAKLNEGPNGLRFSSINGVPFLIYDFIRGEEKRRIDETAMIDLLITIQEAWKSYDGGKEIGSIVPQYVKRNLLSGKKVLEEMAVRSLGLSKDEIDYLAKKIDETIGCVESIFSGENGIYCNCRHANTLVRNGKLALIGLDGIKISPIAFTLAKSAFETILDGKDFSFEKMKALIAYYNQNSLHKVALADLRRAITLVIVGTITPRLAHLSIGMGDATLLEDIRHRISILKGTEKAI